ncbi:MAG: DEAD/DEAH box helicase family protein [Holophagaceae bacterium]|nr:DEAD/DEAH box helicase family protein [Holophagaceae bacterium]
MTDKFFSEPILNSPYEEPRRHWELNKEGQPTQRIIETRRVANFTVAAVPAPQKSKVKPKQEGVQQDFGFFQDDVTKSISSEDRQHELETIINSLRNEVTAWRNQNYQGGKITPESLRLLRHWRHYQFSGVRPFFCQMEAVETAIWLTEMAPTNSRGKQFIDYLQRHNLASNPGLNRIALKLATGAGKTAVMAMLIAWQTINAVRYPNSSKFTKGFLVVTPGITIKDRLRVLLPTDPDSYYKSRQLVPQDMMLDMQKAKIVITNYHAFKLRETQDIARGTRSLLQGRIGIGPNTLETEGQMIQRALGDLMGQKNIMVFNDEGHHCYRVKHSEKRDIELLEGETKGEANREAEENNEAARLWISGLEIIQKKQNILRVFDLSATPFFLRGSGEPEGTLFPWTMSDFSLMDAIECGIVKVPRVPIADNLPDSTSIMPKFRELWKHIGKHMPKKGWQSFDVATLEGNPSLRLLLDALNALYGHYKKVFDQWEGSGQLVPPCFILVCNNTTTSKLLYDYISGHMSPDGMAVKGRYGLFSNYDENGTPYEKGRTILVDSRQLESGDKLPDDFRKIYAAEIDRFKYQSRERGGSLADQLSQGKDIDDATLLREVMNTVGKPNSLGGDIRCVVSVSMLTEGWDANNVTHILGVRAFGTQLLCEQVIGRALRRRSYELNDSGLFSPEYADVLGIPFDFTAEPVVAPARPPIDSIRVHAVRPERDHWEITFPRVVGYRLEMPKEKIRAEFDEDSEMVLSPLLIGSPTETKQAGIAGETAEIRVEYKTKNRRKSIIMDLALHLLKNKWPSPDGNLPMHLYGQLMAIVERWMDQCLRCDGGYSEFNLTEPTNLNTAIEKIYAAIARAGIADSQGSDPPIAAILDSYSPIGSTSEVNFQTSKKTRWTPSSKCHLNYCIYHAEWEAEFCRAAERHPAVIAYVKNYCLGFEVPYSFQGEQRTYIPDFIVKLDDGRGDQNFLNLIVEIKGQRDEADKAKSEAIKNYWLPGVNRLKAYGRWGFEEIRDIYQINEVLDRVATRNS